MARIITCLNCGCKKKHDARGLCHTCYAKIKRNNQLQKFPKIGKPKVLPATCEECGKHLVLEAKGLCRNCYARRNYHKNKGNKRIVICSFCGKESMHESKGMCKACYTRAWRNGGVPVKKGERRKKKRQDICIECGELKEIQARNRCKRCYARWHRRNNPKTYKRYGEKYRKVPGYMKKALENKRKRRSRKRGLLATLTEDEWLDTLKQYDYSCAYCSRKDVKLQREHWIPLSRGGEYTKENMVPACKSCNSKKGTMSGEEFLSFLNKEKIIESLDAAPSASKKARD